MKRFRIAQEHATMKVGTDGVLLGAWATASDPAMALDIGAGSGLITLMLAQRFPDALIHAIEPDERSAYQALANVADSDFFNHIQVFQAALLEWATAAWYRYDLLVCNPPFFSKGLQVPNERRRMARDAAYLPADMLFLSSKKLMTDKGCLDLILPAAAFSSYETAAASAGLYLKRKTSIYSREGKPVERILSSWVRSPGQINEEELILEDHTGKRQPAFHELTREFYL